MEKAELKSVGRGMAKPTDIQETKGIGEFCCADSYFQFQIYSLRRHVDGTKSKLDSITVDNPALLQVSRYLSLVSRTLTAVEKEAREGAREK